MTSREPEPTDAELARKVRAVWDRAGHHLWPDEAETMSLAASRLERPAAAPEGVRENIWEVERTHGDEIKRLACAIHLRSYTTAEAAYEAARITYDFGCRQAAAVRRAALEEVAKWADMWHTKGRSITPQGVAAYCRRLAQGEGEE